MLVIEDIKVEFETVRERAALPSAETMRENLSDLGIDLILERVTDARRRYLAQESPARKMSTGLEARIAGRLSNPFPVLSAKRLGEAGAFFWAYQNPDRALSYTEIGAEIGLNELDTRDSLDSLRERDLISRKTTPTPEVYFYHVASLRRVKEILSSPQA